MKFDDTTPTPEIITWIEPWWKLVRHAAVESQRLALDFGMGNGAGYGTSGGPWITPELSMQQICWSETPVNGPGRISKRRGYELTPFLPTLANRTIGGDDETKRFRADFEATIQDLYRDSYFATLSRILREAGLAYSSEPYPGPWKVPEVAPHIHRVVAEFWSDSGDYRDFWTAATIAAARQCGRNIIEAEAFTSEPNHSLWNEYPGMLKPVSDVAFCEGLNRFVVHRLVHQPWDERYRPGFAMGQWGTHFDRTQAWFTTWDYFTKDSSLVPSGLLGPVRVMAAE